MRRALVRAPAFSSGRLIAGLALVVAAVPVGVYLWAAGHRVAYPYELNWLEGGTVELVGRVMHGQPLYAAPNLTYAGFTYTPLYSYLAAAVAEITGLGFLPLRIVSLAFSLIGFGALFLYVRNATRDWAAGVIAVGLFAALYGRSGWFFDVGRLDSMYVALSVLALWLGRRSETVRGGILVGILAFLAFFTKQVGLICVGPALVAAALARPRVGVTALVTLVVLIGASTLLLDVLTHGWYLFYIVGELAGQPSVSKDYRDFWSLLLFHHLHWLALLAALAGLVGAILAVHALRSRRDGGPSRVLTPRAAISVLSHPRVFDLAAALGLLVAALVSYVHSGSYLNVLIPAYVACAGFGGLVFGGVRGRTGRVGAIGSGIALVLVALQVATLVSLEHVDRKIPNGNGRAAGGQLEAALRRLKGPVFVLRHPWYGTLAGKGVFAQADGLQEILRSKNAKGRTALDRDLPGSLNRYHVQAVVLDSEPAPAWLAPQLAKDFRLVPGTITQIPLRPVADLRSWPTYLYVRRDR